MCGLTALSLKISSGPIDTLGFSRVASGVMFTESESAFIASPDHLNLHFSANTVTFPCSLHNCDLFWLSQVSLDGGHGQRWRECCHCFEHNSAFILKMNQELKEMEEIRVGLQHMLTLPTLQHWFNINLLMMWINSCPLFCKTVSLCYSCSVSLRIS